MKKLFAFLVTVVLCAACAFGVAGCDKKGGHTLSEIGRASCRERV